MGPWVTGAQQYNRRMKVSGHFFLCLKDEFREDTSLCRGIGQSHMRHTLPASSSTCPSPWPHTHCPTISGASRVVRGDDNLHIVECGPAAGLDSWLGKTQGCNTIRCRGEDVEHEDQRQTKKDKASQIGAQWTHLCQSHASASFVDRVTEWQRRLSRILWDAYGAIESITTCTV